MSTDPFAPKPDPADEPEPATSTTTPGPEQGPVVPTEYHPYKFTFKSGSGYEAEWFTASYKDLDSVENDLTGERASQLARVLEAGSRVAAFFRGKGPGVRGSGSQGSSPQNGGSNGAPAGATQAPSWMGKPPYCRHGEKVYKTGVSKSSGDVWHAWACNGPKDNQCTRDENSFEFKRQSK